VSRLARADVQSAIKFFSKNYKSIEKQVEEAFKPKKQLLGATSVRTR